MHQPASPAFATLASNPLETNDEHQNRCRGVAASRVPVSILAGCDQPANQLLTTANAPATESATNPDSLRTVYSADSFKESANSVRPATPVPAWHSENLESICRRLSAFPLIQSKRWATFHRRVEIAVQLLFHRLPGLVRFLALRTLWLRDGEFSAR